MLQIRFGYSTNPKAIIITGEETIKGLCDQHNVVIDSSVVNHNGLPIQGGDLNRTLAELNVQNGDSIIIVTKTNAA